MGFDWEQYPMFYKAFVRNAKGSKGPCVGFTKAEEQGALISVQKRNSFSGVLSENAVMIDFDSREQSDIFTQIIKGEHASCLITDRDGGKGVHALFVDSQGLIKNAGTGLSLAIGLKADIKTGNKNGVDCLKFDGVERHLIYDQPPYQDIPRWLMPVKCNIDFAELGDGDGRNQALFNYILTLQDEGFTVEEIRETIRLINAYVLREPVSEKELEVIIRDDAFKKQSFFKGRTFQHDKFAEHLKRDNHVIKCNGRLHIYQNGIYSPSQDAIELAMVKEIPSLKDAQRKEALKQLNLICDVKAPSMPNFIAFKNGIYDLNTDEFSDFTPDVVITNMIPWPYNPAAQDDLMDQTLDKIACHNASIRALLEEMIGSCMYRGNTLAGGGAFILTGEGANGKSTLLDAVKTMLGTANITSLDLKELDAKFQNAELYGKLANIGDDIGSDYIANGAVFRKLVTGQRIQVQYKGERPFEFESYAKMLFSANDIPRIGRIKEAYAIVRRLVIIPFNAKFTKHDEGYNPNIKYDLQRQPAMEYMIRVGLDGLKRVLKNKAYTICSEVEQALEEYREESNPLLSFIKDCHELGFPIVNSETERVYMKYKEFCMSNNFQFINKIEFSKQLCRAEHLKSKVAKVNKVPTKIYVHA